MRKKVEIDGKVIEYSSVEGRWHLCGLFSGEKERYRRFFGLKKRDKRV
ncbi:hypothetical protein [Paenibacillus sp. NPDC055715]